MDSDMDTNMETDVEELTEVQVQVEDEFSFEEVIRKKIMLILRLYPRVSMSMIQVSLGPQFQARFWRPVLEQLIDDGIVSRTQCSLTDPASGRFRIAMIIHLPENAPPLTIQ